MTETAKSHRQGDHSENAEYKPSSDEFLSGFYKTEGLENKRTTEDFVIVGNTLISHGKKTGNIVIPDGVVSIGTRAFNCCEDLTSVTIPNSVTKIGSQAFEGTPWLKSRRETEDFVIAGKNILISYGKKTGDIVIPDGVVSINRYAFLNCSDLTSVVIPSSVTSIGEDEFSGCKNLTSVTIPNSVTSISKFAFEDCSHLEDIYYTGTGGDWAKLLAQVSWDNVLHRANVHFI